MIALRCALVWTAATAAVTLLGTWALDAPSVAGFEGLLLRACSLAVVACLAWAWLAVTAVVLDAVRRRPRARRGVPAGLRRLVLAACGVAIAAGASPSFATSGPVPIADTSPPVVVVPSATTTASVVVRRGDSLWMIASRTLGGRPDDADVTRAWQRIYERNRDLIGADPGLIVPGQRLELPR